MTYFINLQVLSCRHESHEGVILITKSEMKEYVAERLFIREGSDEVARLFDKKLPSEVTNLINCFNGKLFWGFKLKSLSGQNSMNSIKGRAQLKISCCYDTGMGNVKLSKLFDKNIKKSRNWYVFRIVWQLVHWVFGLYWIGVEYS